MDLPDPLLTARDPVATAEAARANLQKAVADLATKVHELSKTAETGWQGELATLSAGIEQLQTRVKRIGIGMRTDKDAKMFEDVIKWVTDRLDDVSKPGGGGDPKVVLASISAALKATGTDPGIVYKGRGVSIALPKPSGAYVGRSLVTDPSDIDRPLQPLGSEYDDGEPPPPKRFGSAESFVRVAPGGSIAAIGNRNTSGSLLAEYGAEIRSLVDALNKLKDVATADDFGKRSIDDDDEASRYTSGSLWSTSKALKGGDSSTDKAILSLQHDMAVTLLQPIVGLFASDIDIMCVQRSNSLAVRVADIVHIPKIRRIRPVFTERATAMSRARVNL